MKRMLLSRVVGTLGLAILLLPEPASAQVGGGLRDRVGSSDRGSFRDRGSYRGGRTRDRGGFRGSFGIWLGPSWDSFWWGPQLYPSTPYYPYGYRYGYPYRYSYPYPYGSYDRYYVAPPLVVQPAPPEEAPEGGGEADSWYRCEDPQGYYPYVRECPGGWTAVPATPEVAPPEAATPPPPPVEARRPSAPEPATPVPEEYRWYYCEDPEGYYPYVRECPSGWKPVSPAPVPGQ